MGSAIEPERAIATRATSQEPCQIFSPGQRTKAHFLEIQMIHVRPDPPDSGRLLAADIGIALQSRRRSRFGAVILVFGFAPVHSLLVVCDIQIHLRSRHAVKERADIHLDIVLLAFVVVVAVALGICIRVRVGLLSSTLVVIACSVPTEDGQHIAFLLPIAVLSVPAKQAADGPSALARVEPRTLRAPPVAFHFVRHTSRDRSGGVDERPSERARVDWVGIAAEYVDGRKFDKVGPAEERAERLCEVERTEAYARFARLRLRWRWESGARQCKRIQSSAHETEGRFERVWVVRVRTEEASQPRWRSRP